MKKTLVFILMVSTPALAQDKPMTPEEAVPRYKIQMGQLLIENGNLEIEVAKLKADLAKSSQKPTPSESHP